MSKRKNTRVARLLGVAMSIAILAATIPKERSLDPATMPVQVMVAETTVIKEEQTPEEEFSPIRDDIPLDDETQLLLYQACCRTGVQYELALAVVWKETNFRNVTGDSGASIGYMQVQPRWHGDRMERLGVMDLADPYWNFLVGCDYLSELLEKDRGVEWALMAYNGGPSYANKMAQAEKVSKYAENVLNYMNHLGGN